MNKAAHSVLLLAEAGGDLLHYGAAVGGIAHVLQVSNQTGGGAAGWTQQAAQVQRTT